MIEVGRNACLRWRWPPSTRMHASGYAGSKPGSPGCGAWIGNALWRIEGCSRGFFDVVVGTEAEVVVLLLRRRVDPPALIARERPLLVVAGDDVLPELRADRLEQVAEMADDRKVADDRVTLLRHVVDRDEQEQCAGADAEPEPRRHATELISSWKLDGLRHVLPGRGAPQRVVPGVLAVHGGIVAGRPLVRPPADALRREVTRTDAGARVVPDGGP